MSIYDIDQLTTPLTPDEVEASIYQTVAIAGTDHTSWKSRAIMRIMIRGASIILAAMSSLSALIAQGGYLEKAAGAWLTLLAYFGFGVTRQPASFAAGNVTFDNTAGLGSYSEAVGAITLTDPDTGIEFVNTAVLLLAPGGTVTVAFQAREAGTAGTSQAGGISVISSPSMAGCTCTNPTAFVGRDEETDAQLRVRCREKLGSLSPMGPWDAYSYAAKTAIRTDGILAGITRVNTDHDGYGNVTAYVASDSGTVTGTIGDTATDLGAADEAMQLRAVTQCITLTTLSATGVPFTLTITVWAYDSLSLTNSQLTTLIEANLIDFFKSRPIGGDKKPGGTGYVYLDGIENAIMSARPEIYACEVAGGYDAPITASQVPTLGSVVVSVVRVNLESLQ